MDTAPCRRRSASERARKAIGINGDIGRIVQRGAALRERGDSALLDTLLSNEVLPIGTSYPERSDVIGHVVPPSITAG